MDTDKVDFEHWLTEHNLAPTRRQKTIWLIVWRASRETLPKEPKRSWFAKLMDILG
jgi:hypothetical protein